MLIGDLLIFSVEVKWKYIYILQNVITESKLMSFIITKIEVSNPLPGCKNQLLTISYKIPNINHLVYASPIRQLCALHEHAVTYVTLRIYRGQADPCRCVSRSWDYRPVWWAILNTGSTSTNTGTSGGAATPLDPTMTPIPSHSMALQTIWERKYR